MLEALKHTHIRHWSVITEAPACHTSQEHYILISQMKICLYSLRPSPVTRHPSPVSLVQKSSVGYCCAVIIYIKGLYTLLYLWTSLCNRLSSSIRYSHFPIKNFLDTSCCGGWRQVGPVKSQLWSIVWLYLFDHIK